MKSTFNHVKNTLKNKVVQVGYSTSKVVNYISGQLY